jgi:hypothetical protein
LKQLGHSPWVLETLVPQFLQVMTSEAMMMMKVRQSFE